MRILLTERIDCKQNETKRENWSLCPISIFDRVHVGRDSMCVCVYLAQIIWVRIFCVCVVQANTHARAGIFVHIFTPWRYWGSGGSQFRARTELRIPWDTCMIDAFMAFELSMSYMHTTKTSKTTDNKRKMTERLQYAHTGHQLASNHYSAQNRIKQPGLKLLRRLGTKWPRGSKTHVLLGL